MPLKAQLRTRFDKAIGSVPDGTWKTLIVDKHTHDLLYSVYTEKDILQKNVKFVEPLMSPRRAQQNAGVYILTPTEQNVHRIVADFSNGHRTYTSAHLFFTDGLDDRLASVITDHLGPMGVLEAFQELYCDFWVLQDRVFSTQSPQSFFTFFGTPGGAAVRDVAMEAFLDDVAVTGRTILDVLATFNENPYIRYYQPTHHAPLGPLVETMNQPQAPGQPQPQQPNQAGASSRWRAAMGSVGSRTSEVVGEHLSKKIASTVQDELDRYLAMNPDFAANNEGRPRGTLFVVDRSMDLAAPFLHEFFYQAMINDLLPLHDGKHYEYMHKNASGGEEKKVGVLSDLLDKEDEVWLAVRHMHMKDAIDYITGSFGKFARENAGFSGNAQDITMDDLKDLLATLPGFQEKREQFSMHVEMSSRCMDMFAKNKINLAANVEQCCATEKTPEGKAPKFIVEEMVPLLDEKSLSTLDKVRIIALYILFRDGVADEDRRRLFQHAKFGISEQDMVNNLVHLGAKIIKGDGKDRFRGTHIKTKANEGEYDLSRYKTVIQHMIEEHQNGRLSTTQFPYLRDVPQELMPSMRGHTASPVAAAAGTSLRSARPTWQKPSSARNLGEGRQRYIIFIAGGVTYSEIRQVYELSKAFNKDIYIGSTHIVTPEQFLKDLRSLGRGGIGGNPPHAPRQDPRNPGRPGGRPPGGPMPYQRVLNMRYWEPEVGPPPLAPPPIETRPSARTLNSSASGASFLHKNMENLSINSSKSSSLGRKEGGEKKKLFKMKWGKDKD